MSSGNGRNGTVTTAGSGSASFPTTHQVGTGSIDLMGSSTNGAYVSVPASLNAMGATTAVTLAAWVNLTTDRAWARVFDFNNSGTTGYHVADDVPEHVDAQLAELRDLKNRQRHCPADDLLDGATVDRDVASHRRGARRGSTYTGTLYVDGAVASNNTAMTFRPSDLGNTANNWIGRSAFSGDPYFSQSTS